MNVASKVFSLKKKIAPPYKKGGCGKKNAVTYQNLPLDNVVAAKRAMKETVKILTNKAQFRSVEQDFQLSFARAELRSIERELKRRIVQLRLF